MGKRARQLLARRVRALRRLRGWSQERLAERCGLHRAYVGAVERAERNIGLDNIERIAEALGVGELLSVAAAAPRDAPGPASANDGDPEC